MRDLGRAPDNDAARAVRRRHHPAPLDRSRGDTRMRDLALDHDVRAGKGLFDLTEAAAAGEVEIPGNGLVHKRRSGGRRAIECPDGREGTPVQATQANPAPRSA